MATETNISSNKRIAKNTLFLYIRMIVVMGVTIYTARIVLDTLGIDNYGIYNLVAGVVLLFNFLNSSMTGCTQRYLCVAIGKNDAEYEQKVFSTSMQAHIVISGLFLLLAETVGLWFVAKVLNIPSGSRVAAVIAYEIAVFTSIFNILRVPYNGAIVANERMSFYAYSSIVETVLKLLILLPLVYINVNKLILYSVLLALVNIVILIWYWLYVRRHFKNCRFGLKERNRPLFIEMMKFTGWSNFSSIANLSAKQGLSFILNHFIGIAVNAAVGIMNQVTTAVYGFINNFMTAVNPPLIKCYVSEQWDELRSLMVKSTKFSFYLMLILSVPIIMSMESILAIWLKEVPEYTGYFCILSLISLLPNVIGAPIWTVIQASGKIKSYQKIIGIVILLNLPADYILLKAGVSPYNLLVVTFILNSIVDAVGLVFVSRFTPIKVSYMFRKVIVPSVMVAVLAFMLCYCAHLAIGLTQRDLWSVLCHVAIDVIIVGITSYMIGLTKSERHSIYGMIRSKL